ncbi:hypothetical protein So717_21240 [Roseobacter cerasinus]|uniref:Uncharacterized protein n=1 Tax=Roseobacter cerasinus TaxID=2602289 RepID=A0A640VTF9_9RHOB|nr:hypothetical protein [Roseobacter cerasinus]GFE50371.1 hypothetical protein So717_21240 [Roseobacter cerasinus]
MALDKLVLICLCVIAAFGVTLWLAALVLTALHVPAGWLALIPAALVGYVFYRVLSERLGNADEDHYDRMKH